MKENETQEPALGRSSWRTFGVSFAVLAFHFAVANFGNWLWQQRSASTPVLFGQTVAIALLLLVRPGRRRLVFVGTSLSSAAAVVLSFGFNPWLLLGSVLGNMTNMLVTLGVMTVGARWQARGGTPARRLGLSATIFWVTLLAPIIAAGVAKSFATLGGVVEVQQVFWSRWASNLIGAISVLPLALSYSHAHFRKLYTAPSFYLTWLVSLLTTWAAAAYFPFPFVVIALPLLYAASRFLVLGASMIGLTNVLFLIFLSLQPWQHDPALHEHTMYVPFALVFTLVSPLVVALIGQQRAETLRELARAHELMAVEAERRRIMLDSIGDAVVSVDANLCVQYLNPIAERLTGFTQSEAVGLPVEDVLQLFEDGGGGIVGEKASNPLIRCMTTRQIVVLEDPLVLRHRDGSVAYVGDSSAPVLSSDRSEVVGAVAVFQDVTQKHQAARAMQRRAMHDALTDLFNRQEFEHRVRALLAERGERASTHVACFMDLDRFKAVNDTHGHAAGDAVLKMVASTLSAKTRASDIVARLGGDEFAWVLRRCPDDVALRLANELVSTIESLRVPWEGHSLQVGASVGLVGFGAGTSDYETLLRHADSACYAAKRAGRGRVAVYAA